MSFAGLTERRWLGTFQTITSVTDAKLVVADTYGFFVGQVLSLTKVGEEALAVKVRQVFSRTEISVGNPDMGFSHRFNQTELLPYSGGSATAYEQARPPIGDDVVFRAVYAEEPILALRNLLVDKYGQPIDSTLRSDGSNALNVDATVNMSVDTAQNPVIANYSIATADTDTLIMFPVGTKKFSMKLRGDKGPLRVYDMPSGDFYTVSKGSIHDSGPITRPTPLYLTVQSAQSGSILEVFYWT